MMRVFGIVGWKNNGKTTLVVRLVEHLIRRSYSVSTIKHAHHDCDVDHPGKDSFRHREAGATEVMLATSRRWMLVHELRDEQEPELSELLAKLAPVDVVIVEGFKRHPHPKIEVHRKERATPLLAHTDRSIVAVASDEQIPDCPVPVFDLNDVEIATAIVLRSLELEPGP
jgi:molybdopterin-guanine dinucleotide biosynthesis protein MobB